MTDVLDKITILLEPLLEGTDMFMVSIKLKPINNIKLYLDADSGLSIGKCAEINRKLYRHIEQAQWYPEGDFSLEVSSPGVDEPLVTGRQYTKNIGRTVLVTPLEGDDILGVLTEVKDEMLTLAVEVKVGKLKETKMVELPFSEIKKIVVQITF